MIIALGRLASRLLGRWLRRRPPAAPRRWAAGPVAWRELSDTELHAWLAERREQRRPWLQTRGRRRSLR